MFIVSFGSHVENRHTRVQARAVLRASNLVPRVLWLFGQRVGANRDSGVLEFSYRKISAVKQWKSLQGSQSKNLDFFEFPRVSTGAHPLTKKPEDSGHEIGSGSEDLCHAG